MVMKVNFTTKAPNMSGKVAVCVRFTGRRETPLTFSHGKADLASPLILILPIITPFSFALPSPYIGLGPSGQI